MSKYSKFVSKTFDEVAESDFNPDMVLDGMKDCSDDGMVKGFILGITVSGICEIIKIWLSKKEN